MKKKLLVILMAFGISRAIAQDLTSKKGEKFLPEVGEWAIGFDAMPALNAIGTIMGGSNSGTQLTIDNGTAIFYGKKFTSSLFPDVSKMTAIRAMVGLNFGSVTSSTSVPKIQVTPTDDKVNNSSVTSTNDITLAGGYEIRQGKTRLQGVFGAMMSITIGNGAGNKTYTYGNSLSELNPGIRTASENSASKFGLGLTGFCGLEYFLIPKISLGAEYNLGFNFISNGASVKTEELWDSPNKTTKTKESKGDPSSAFGLGNGITSIRVMFHF